jgi:uncharacterized membrane protein
MSIQKTTSKTIYIFVTASILAIMALAYLFRPPLDKRVRRPHAIDPHSQQ